MKQSLRTEIPLSLPAAARVPPSIARPGKPTIYRPIRYSSPVSQGSDFGGLRQTLTDVNPSYTDVKRLPLSLDEFCSHGAWQHRETEHEETHSSLVGAKLRLYDHHPPHKIKSVSKALLHFKWSRLNECRCLLEGVAPDVGRVQPM